MTTILISLTREAPTLRPAVVTEQLARWLMPVRVKFHSINPMKSPIHLGFATW